MSSWVSGPIEVGDRVLDGRTGKVWRVLRFNEKTGIALCQRSSDPVSKGTLQSEESEISHRYLLKELAP